MAAASLADFETLYQFACKAEKGNKDSVLTLPWATVAWSLRNLIDDRNALYAVCVAVSATPGEATSKALTDAGITASDLRVGA
jgi:hypothetical protein